MHSNLLRKNNPQSGDHVGRYLFKVGSESIKVAIDAADHHGIRDSQAYEWADIYFKANKWKNRQYPDKVLPITSGEITLQTSDIDRLRRLRNSPKTRDLVFISRIWPGHQDRLFDTIEHNVRLFESLAKVNGSKELLAIIPSGLYKNPQIQPYLVRLETAGVPWTTHKIATSDLLTSLARAKVVLLRSGKHLSIPGRLHWYLCLGSCVVFDTKPFPQWYKPLQEGEHYLSCNCGLTEKEALPPDNNYSQVTRTVEDLLSDKGMINRMRDNGIAYFDNYGCPEKLAAYIVETILLGQRLNSNSMRLISNFTNALTTDAEPFSTPRHPNDQHAKRAANR